MIGKSLNERHGRAYLSSDRATALLQEVLGTHARELVEVRKQGPEMVACVFAHAGENEVKTCLALGLELTLGKTGVLGLAGPDVVQVFPSLTPRLRAWVEAPCAARETKVVLVSGGMAFLSIHAGERGAPSVTVVPFPVEPPS